MKYHIFSKDEVIFNKGDEGDSMFIIMSGTVNTHYAADSPASADSTQRLTETFCFGEKALQPDGKPRDCTAIASENTACLSLSRFDFLENTFSFEHR